MFFSKSFIFEVWLLSEYASWTVNFSPKTKQSSEYASASTEFGNSYMKLAKFVKKKLEKWQ